MIKVQPLTLPEVRATYTLVREAAPMLGLTEWTRFARRLVAPMPAGKLRKAAVDLPQTPIRNYMINNIKVVPLLGTTSSPSDSLPFRLATPL